MNLETDKPARMQEIPYINYNMEYFFYQLKMLLILKKWSVNNNMTNCDRSICIMQDYNGGCDTCSCNPVNQPECCYQMEEEVNNILWYHFFNDSFSNVESFECDVFVIKPYNWDEYVGEGENDWNFYHIPSGLKIQWYKYPLRSPMSNMEITHEQFLEVLKDCRNYLEDNNKLSIGVKYHCYEWWKNRRD